MSKQTKPSIVFAHGLWADGSCFQKLIPPLQADGHEVMCSQHGLDSLKSDVDCVTRCFGRVNGPVVLVGHSYGGTLITHAGTDDRVAALVYIAALAPEETETSQSQQQKFPVTEVADGRIWLKPDGIAYFAGDLPEAERKVVWATQAVPCLICSCKRSTASLGGRSRVGTLWPPKIAPSNPNCTASSPNVWAPQPSKSKAAMFRCYPNLPSCST